MPIVVSCSCGGRFQAPDSMAGRRTPCPACQMPLVVPASNPPAALDADVFASASAAPLPGLPQPRPKPWLVRFGPWLKVAIPLAIVVGALGIVLLLVSLLLRSWSQPTRAVEDALVALQVAGKPTTVEEWDASYALPTDVTDETSKWLSAGRAAYNASKNSRLPIIGSSSDVPAPPKAWSQFDQARKFIDAHRNSLTPAYQAAESGGLARYPVNFSGGYAQVDLQHVEMLRAVPRLLLLDAWVHAHQDNAPGVATDLSAAIRSINALQYEPIMTTQVARVGMLATVATQGERLLNCMHFTDQEFARLQQDLRSLEFSHAFWRGIDGDRLHGILIHQDSTLVDSPLPNSDSSHAYFLQKLAEISQYEGQPWHVVLPALKEIEVSFTTESRTISQRLAHGFATLNLPLLEVPASAMARATAQRDMLDAGIACLRYQQANGRDVDSLAALVPQYLPQVPTDPFDELPLRLRQTDEHLLIYSIGSNGADELANSGNISGDGADIILQLKKIRPAPN